MKPILQQRIRNLGSLERSLKPEAAWVRATRETLLMQARNSMPTTALSSTQRFSELMGYMVPSRMLSVVRGPLMAVVAVLLVALGGSVASVSAAENSLPGDLLYSLKLATEQARLAFTPSRDEKLKLKLEFNARRGEELKKVAHVEDASRQGRVERATDILKRDLKTVKEQLKEVKSEDEPMKVAEMAKLVDQKSQELVQTLQETKSTLSLESKDRVTETQAVAADAGVAAIEVLAEKHQESDAVVAKTEVIEAIQGHARTVAEVTGAPLPGSASSSLAEFSTSTTNGTSTVPTLEETVEQVKIATQQAFAAQYVSGTEPTVTSTTVSENASSTSSSTTVPLLGQPTSSSTVSSTATVHIDATSTTQTGPTSSSTTSTVTPP